MKSVAESKFRFCFEQEVCYLWEKETVEYCKQEKLITPNMFYELTHVMMSYFVIGRYYL